MSAFGPKRTLASAMKKLSAGPSNGTALENFLPCAAMGTLHLCNKQQHPTPPDVVVLHEKKEAVMKRILLAVSALAIAGAATLTSVNAQGVGVQVGPVGVGVGVGPYWDGGYPHRYYRA